MRGPPNKRCCAQSCTADNLTHLSTTATMSASILASSTMTRPVVVSRTPQRSVCLGNVSGLRAASRHSQIKQRGSLLIMANEKQGKGGEEGGRKFDDSVFGKLAKSPNFTLLASSAVKVRRPPLALVIESSGYHLTNMAHLRRYRGNVRVLYCKCELEKQIR